MSYIDTVSREKSLVSFWRHAAVAALEWCEGSQVKKKSGVVGEKGEVGSGVAMILWHKATRSKLLTAMRAAASELLVWCTHFTIGNPHQELIPWCGWLRTVQARHPDWMIAWPEEDYLHP
jgi:hypothetical protein